jgi:hypothetical protein
MVNWFTTEGVTLKLSPVQTEILLGRFSEWVHPLMPREGEGARNGFSPRKYWCALHQALFGPLTLRQILEASTTDVSQNVLKVWRGEPEFKQVAQQAAQDFATFVVQEVLAEAGHDPLKRLVLTELLVMLPGFDIGRNKIVDTLSDIVTELEADTTKASKFKRLYDCLLCYRDVVRLAHQYARGLARLRIEKEVGRAVGALQEKAMTLVKTGGKNGTLDESLVEAFGAVDISLTFLANFSTLVV